ncbi:MAG: M56 family metallopeptidase [Saprospiraceae bacterium]|nr:M56 family metallopeptidase [Saprospiraceae bacterium]
MTTFIIQSTICWFVLYLLYYAVLRKTTFFILNRIYLLGALLSGAGILYLTDFFKAILNEETRTYLAVNLPVMEFSGSLPQQSAAGFPWLMAIYLVGATLAFVRFFYGILRIYRLYQSGAKERHPGYTLVFTAQNHLPFSFFNLVFAGRQFSRPEIQEKVVGHESIHIHQWHSVDLLLMEILHCIFWFNPMLYFYKRAIRQNHEYLADVRTVQRFSMKSYIDLLLNPSGSHLELTLASHFYQSQIKNRINMLQANRSSKKDLALYLLSPLVLIATAIIMSSSTPQFWTPSGFSAGSQDTIPAPPPPPDVAAPAPPAPPAPPSASPAPPAPPAPPAKKKSMDAASKSSLTLAPEPPASNADLMPADQLDEMPRFPGCESMGTKAEKESCASEKLMRFVFSTMKYPEDARKKGIEGQCFAKFRVDKNGYIHDIVIEQDPGAGIGKEVTRIVETMNQMPERWIPGKKNGKAVNAMMTLPVKFKLDNAKSGK